VTVEYVLFATIMRMVEHQSAKFSVFSLVIREFDHGDWFASDCTIRQRVLLRLQFIEKSSKYAPVRTDFVWLMAAENASIGGFRRFAIGFIR
jgi:hypothetical protein